MTAPVVSKMQDGEAAGVRIAVLGLGEAGLELARDLVAAGALVCGYDPRLDRVAPPGARDCTSEAGAVPGAAVVLSANSASDAEEALQAAPPAAGARTLWADLNTAAPAPKRRLAAIARPTGIVFADVALTSAVPGRGVQTPMLVSGPGAAQWAKPVRALGATVDVVDGPPGAAAQHKLLRSVFFKGMGAAVVEALATARESGGHRATEPIRLSRSIRDRRSVSTARRGRVRPGGPRARQGCASSSLSSWPSSL